MIVCEHTLENAIRKFFNEMRIQRPNHWPNNFDLLFLKKSVPCFISALQEIEDVGFCYGFDESKTITED